MALGSLFFCVGTIAVKLARRHPELDVWVSTGSKADAIADIFEAAGVLLSRVHMDYRAVDTVTNFKGDGGGV